KVYFTGAEIQKKWKNLKDCFSRELTAQKNFVSRQSGKKRRKYIFDQLSFLIPVHTPRETSGSVKSMDEYEKSDIQSDEESTPQKQDSRRSTHLRKTGVTVAKAKKGNTDFDEELLDILLLIPMLRKLNDDQKFNAKMEILNAMDRAKRYVSVSQPQYPGSSL
ncbi:uncharacterized protein, partial [Choristoneura fumiferana]|uniref:uncharacterized protein n=1 Tax=Choristoneura fumiferana TaxID=7141 RepID=UPI003D1576B3